MVTTVYKDCQAKAIEFCFNIKFNYKETTAMREFSLLIKPASADCNLNCEYCFYLEKCHLYPDTPRHRMTEAVLEQMVKNFMGTSQSTYSFGWQGGEPTLMGLPFFEKVVEFQQKFGRAGDSVANGLQTNATLIDDPLAEHFRKFRFLLGCSLDGPPSIHDKFRLNAAGKPSHASVIKGLEILKKHQVEFNILVLVSQANVKEAKTVYRYLVENGYYYQQYIPCVEVDDHGELLPFSINGAEWGEFMCELFDEWYPDRYQVSIRHFDSLLFKLVDGVSNVCVLGRNCCQYFVVEYNGDIYPCDFFVEESQKLGNILDTSWETAMHADRYIDFGNQKTEWNNACSNCSCVELCNGDCLKHRVYANHKSDNLSYLCQGWKQFNKHSNKRFEDLASEIRRTRYEEAKQRAPKPRPAASTKAVGRNDPCSCGSGLKFKKCCGKGS